MFTRHRISHSTIFTSFQESSKYEQNTKVRKMQLKMQLNKVDNGENVITHCDIFLSIDVCSSLLLASFRERYRYANKRFNSSSRAHDSSNEFVCLKRNLDNNHYYTIFGNNSNRKNR